jgi:hypothetical protein
VWLFAFLRDRVYTAHSVKVGQPVRLKVKRERAVCARALDVCFAIILGKKRACQKCEKLPHGGVGGQSLGQML